MKSTLGLADGIRIADRVVAVLGPYCARIAIAGSIRRCCEQVGDVDIVCMAHPGQDAALRSRAKLRSSVVSEGRDSLVLRLPTGVQVDLWFAQEDTRDLLSTSPSTWGTVLLSRTGSREHNIRLCQRAQALGVRWDPLRGVFRGDQHVASATEDDVFSALGLRHIPAALRDGSVDHDEYSTAIPAPADHPKRDAKPVSDRDAATMFQRMRAICASAGDELQRRVTMPPTTTP